MKPQADFTPGRVYLPPRGDNILVLRFPDSPAEQENFIWPLSFLLFRFPGGFSVPECLVLAAPLLPRDTWLPTEVGLSSDGCKHWSPQEFPLTPDSKKEKYFTSTHQSDDYNGTVSRGHIKTSKLITIQFNWLTI